MAYRSQRPGVRLEDENGQGPEIDGADTEPDSDSDDGSASPSTFKEPRVVDPTDAAAAAADDAKSPAPVTQYDTPAPAPAATDTLTPTDIAQVAVQAQAPAAQPAIPADQDPDVLALMQARYHSDPDQVARQLAAATGGAAGSSTTTTDDANLGPTTPGAPTMESILQNRLIELMGRSAVPSESDPEIAATLQATRAAGQRAFDRNAADLAERASYAGQSNSGAAEAGRAALRQAQGETEQQITAQTFRDAATRRIAELQQTLQTAGSLLDSKQQRAMQLQIAQLQDATQRYGISTGDATDRYGISEGGRQFDAGLAEKIREYGLDAAARDAGMSSSAAASAAGLDERRYEFDKNYGIDERAQTLNESKFTQGQNSDPILQWLIQNYGPRE